MTALVLPPAPPSSVLCEGPLSTSFQAAAAATAAAGQ